MPDPDERRRKRWTQEGKERPGEERPGAGEWISLALFLFAIAAIIFGLAVLRCTAE